MDAMLNFIVENGYQGITHIIIIKGVEYKVTIEKINE